MFSNCRSLTKLDLSNFDTSNASDMYHMFGNNVSLVELNLTGWNLIGADMDYMFSECKSLTKLNITDWYISSCSKRHIFNSLDKGKIKIIASDQKVKEWLLYE